MKDKKAKKEIGVKIPIGMNKNLITLLLIIIIGFLFTTNSYAIILENMPTDSKSAQPIPQSIVQNMSNDFDISSYILIKQNEQKKLEENIKSNSNPLEKILHNQNIFIEKDINPINLFLLILIIILVVYLLFKRLKR